MAAGTICSDFGAQKNKVWHCFHCLPIYFPWSDGTRCHDLSFLNVELKANFLIRPLLLGLEVSLLEKSLIHNQEGYYENPWKNFSVQFSSVTQSCPTLCDPINCRTPGLPVHHQLLEFTQTQVHRVGDAIQPSHPLLSPSPPAPNPSQHQGLFQWVLFTWGG